MHAGRWLNAQRVKFRRIWINRYIVFFEFGKAWNDAATVTKYTNRPAFPVAFTGTV